jgi:hypothetical protein
LVFETRGLVNKNKEFPFKVANEFYTTEGVVRGGKFTPKQGGKTYDVEVEPIHVTDGGTFGSFINCVRSRKVEEVNGEIEQAHYSAALCHLGNISYRLGREVPFSQKPTGFFEVEEVQESLRTISENLKVALGMDLDKYTYVLGPKLNFDPEKERFVGNPEADKLLTRDYREPFVVTESV